MANIPNMMTVLVLLQQVSQVMTNLEMAELEQIAQQLNEMARQATEQLGRERDVEARPRNTKFREMTHPLPHRTFVRHITTNRHEAIGIYNAERGVLEWEGQTFEYPSGFAKEHSRRPVNGWGQNVCHAFLNGHWVSLHTLR